jgi:poly(A) polymerase
LIDNLCSKTIPFEQHGISPSKVSSHALKVVSGLQKAGHEAYLVGGCVRDLILGYEPKDFDVATNAEPEQVRRLFSNCRLIGRRFRLAHVRFGREIIEVATYRAGAGEGAPEDDDLEHSESGRILRDNVYGTREQDALRRDFTINALYYDPATETVLDDVGGFCDLREGQIRVIGDPEQRYREDPVRMLRAMRFAAKLGLRVEEKSLTPIHALATLLGDVPPARMFEEILKLFHGGCALQVFELIRQHGLFRIVFPDTDAALEGSDDVARQLIPRALKNTDDRINIGKHVNPAFVFAVLLWPLVQKQIERRADDGASYQECLRLAARDALSDHLRHSSIPKRFSTIMRDMWFLQPRLERRIPRTIFRLLESERFRAAYDFMCLRAAAGELPEELCQWWTQIQEQNEDGKRQMIAQLPKPGGKRRRRKKKKKS